MNNTPTSALLLALLFVVSFFLPLTTFAQDGSVESQSKVPPAPAPIEETITTPADPVIMAPRDPDPGIFMEATSTPQDVVPTPTPGASTNQTSVATSTPVENIDTAESADANYILWLALAALAILPLGYVAAQSLKNKTQKEQEKDSNRCFNLKEMLEKKFKELTNLKGQLQGEVKGKVRDVMHEGLKGTSTGELLVLVEKAEKEYGRLKKLYEECMVEFGKTEEIVMYEKSTCTKCRAAVEILDTYGAKYRTVRYHDEPLSEEKLRELIRKLGIRPTELLRTNDPVYRSLGLDMKKVSDEEAISLMLKHPDLIQRPILEQGDKAVIGRESERINEFLQKK